PDHVEAEGVRDAELAGRLVGEVDLGEVERERRLDALRTGVFLEAADQHLGEVHLVDLEALALDGLDTHKLRRLEVIAGRRILQQRRQAGERMEVNRQRRERRVAGASAATRSKR